MHAPFAIGDQVIASAFTDCFGKFHPESAALTVENVTLVQSTHTSPHAVDVDGMRITATFNDQPYYRILAHGEGLTSYEAAARCFRKA